MIQVEYLLLAWN